MDEEVAVAAAAGPQERVEALHLVQQFADAVGLRRRREEADRSVLPIGRSRVMSPIWPSLMRLNSLAAGGAVAAHQTDADLEVLAFSDSSPSFSIRRVEGPSTVIGFSMKTLSPFLMA